MRKSNRSKPIDVEIDKLTNSIELAATGDVFNTTIVRVTIEDLRLIKKAGWLFNWHREVRSQQRQVYRLMTENNPDIIQGLISMEDKGDHIYMHLIESAGFNRGGSKTFLGVPGNLIAHGCRLSMELGYDGFVAFTAKTALIEHYKKELGAEVLHGTLMQLNSVAARNLVQRYKL
ncbi:MAG: hypothetical protein JNM62_16890 [Flavobacteriales bacterium]|nr:hypothetical protein [Flavobacteriales bacterium]